jgi:hypothetical protein
LIVFGVSGGAGSELEGELHDPTVIAITITNIVSRRRFIMVLIELSLKYELFCQEHVI